MPAHVNKRQMSTLNKTFADAIMRSPYYCTRHSAEFKAKVALAALSESKSLAELASEATAWLFRHRQTKGTDTDKLRL